MAADPPSTAPPPPSPKETDQTEDYVLLELIHHLLTFKKSDDSRNELLNQGYEEVEIRPADVKAMKERAVPGLLKQPTLLRLDEAHLPLMVVTDLHGQFNFLRRQLLPFVGHPKEQAYLFCGDYVDRGAHGTEVFLLLLALKLRYPNKVFMLRGNHEDVNQTVNYGFYEECIQRWGDKEGLQCWRDFIEMFNCLPLAALITTTKGRRLLCMHGGISPFIQSLEDIDKIVRPSIIPAFGPMTDLVWSDPVPGRDGWGLSHRGISFGFGEAELRVFCETNQLDFVIRGHQIYKKMFPYGYDFFQGGRLVTVFSAANYQNKKSAGATIRIAPDGRMRVFVFRPAGRSVPASRERRSPEEKTTKDRQPSTRAENSSK